MSNYDLPADVLERAIYEVGLDICGSHDGWHSATPLERKTAEVHVHAALPVIVPAIREALVREMMAELPEPQYIHVVGEDPDCVHHVELLHWLRNYLPAAEERESEGAR